MFSKVVSTLLEIRLKRFVEIWPILRELLFQPFLRFDAVGCVGATR